MPEYFYIEQPFLIQLSELGWSVIAQGVGVTLSEFNTKFEDLFRDRSEADLLAIKKIRRHWRYSREGAAYCFHRSGQFSVDRKYIAISSS